MWGIAGSRQPQFLDALARSHATVEDRVRAGKAMGLRNLPSKKWQVNAAWMPAANLGHDLNCWVRLPALHGVEDLALARPDTMRHRLYSIPARLVRHARRRRLRLDRTWPWADAFALEPGIASPGFRPSADGHHPDKPRKESRSGPVEPGAAAASHDGPPHRHRGQTGHRPRHSPPTGH
uniref:Transposase n=1 Tax=Streptomyces sp. NBC_00180 TaxID=2903632 RepID=A0AAU1I999_9ACTN